MVKDMVESEIVRPAEPARTANALLKRAEQLKRWEESDTNKESAALKPIYARKVKFPEGCVFLAACASGDVDEVEHLLEQGADINTTNVDGLTALHQAVIDQNLDMVQFLIDNGADIDAQDNEGWTPLMAGISCNFTDIVRFLLDKMADPALLNNDGELPVDLAETDEMRSLIESEIRRRGINLEEARRREEQLMIRDAMEWARSSKITMEKRHPKTGATALHVAAAKGYIKVMGILLQGGADVNAKDYDGWTPLHAAAHWGERQACELLVENMCNMDEKNFLGQTAFVVADSDMAPFLETLKKKQETLKEKRPSAERSTDAGVQRASVLYNKRKNSVTRTSTGDKMKISKADEVKEAEVLRASSSEASDNEEENNMDDEDEKETVKQPTTAAAIVDKKRSDVVETNGVVESAASKIVSESSQTIVVTPTESTSTSVTSVAPYSLASVSVTLVQSPTIGRTVTTVSSAAKNELSRVSVLQKHFGPPVIIPSEPPASPQPAWRLTGRRVVGGVLSPPASPTVVQQSSPSSSANISVATSVVNTSTAPSSSMLSSTNVATTTTNTTASTSDGVRWRKRSEGGGVETNVVATPIVANRPASNVDDKNWVSSSVVPPPAKYPWLRSSSVPAIRLGLASSPTSPPQLTKKPSSTLNVVVLASNNKSFTNTMKTSAKTVSNESLSPSTATSSSVRESRKPTITEPLSLIGAKQRAIKQQQETAVVQHHSPVVATTTNLLSPTTAVVRTVLSPSGGPHFSFPSTPSSVVGVASTNLTPIMENVATRTFTPPQRGDESESERKARAKRERESRRSTQGITLETVKAAEHLFSDRKKHTSTDEPPPPSSTNNNEIELRSPIKTSTAVIDISGVGAKKNEEKISSSSSRPKIWERISSSSAATKSYDSTMTAPVETTTTTSSSSGSALSLLSKNLTLSTSTTTTTTTPSSPYPWRTTRIQVGDSNQFSQQPLRPVQGDEQRTTTEKESSDKSPNSTAAILSRRRTRPNRRSTGPIAQEDVQLAIENDLEPDENVSTPTTATTTMPTSTILSSIQSRHPSSSFDDNDRKSTTTFHTAAPTSTSTTFSTSSNIDQSNLSGYRNNRYPLTKVGNLSDRSSRTSSGISVGGTASPDVDVDYKKMYEKEKSENDRLRETIKDLEKSLENVKLSSKQASGDGMHIIGYDTRLERRLAELEEENKTLETVKSDNQRLKEENGALIRVISKLSKSK